MILHLVDEPESTTAGVVTASATVLTALGGLVLAVSVLIPILRNSRKTLVQVADVHTIVNQQRTDLLSYQQLLIRALSAAGVTVPEDASVQSPDAPVVVTARPLQEPL